MLVRIENFVLYGDTDRESYLAIRGKLESGNRVSSMVFGYIAAVLIGNCSCARRNR